jgi:predicted RecA/RadA family phage recombinase
MATDYEPVYKPGAAFSRTTSADTAAGQLVAVSGVGTVAPTSGVNIAVLGVAAFAALSGQDVTVLCGGVHILPSPGTVTAGDLVTSSTGGGVATYSGTTASQIIGVALDTTANALVTVKLFR